ncbi:DNA-binding regulator [Streptomyces sp. OM5714]|nr:DNA-binding regulator [Streptomyces sp. OM5714]
MPNRRLVAAWAEVIVPTLQAVGRKWETSGDKCVEVEHFLLWHVFGALWRATPHSVADGPGAVTVLACVPGRITRSRWRCCPRR